jgi:hypothetical protein
MRELTIAFDEGAIPVEVITSFAADMGVFFPEKYVRLLSEKNWLAIKENLFNFEGLDGAQDCRDLNFLGYGQSGEPGVNDITDSQDFDVYGYDNLVIAFGYCANGDYICFDYRGDETRSQPSIVEMFHDEYVDDKMAVVHVSNSFESFLELLYAEEDDYFDDDEDDFE